MRAQWILLVSAVAAVAAASACAEADGRPPVARITATPAAIPEHDDFRTEVVLDGSASSDPIDDPDGLEPLIYAWEIEGDEFQLQPGSDPNDPAIAALFRGDTPATLRLTVTDTGDLSNTAELQLQLTVAR